MQLRADYSTSAPPSANSAPFTTRPLGEMSAPAVRTLDARVSTLTITSLKRFIDYRLWQRCQAQTVGVCQARQVRPCQDVVDRLELQHVFCNASCERYVLIFNYK